MIFFKVIFSQCKIWGRITLNVKNKQDLDVESSSAVVCSWVFFSHRLKYLEHQKKLHHNKRAIRNILNIGRDLKCTS